MEPGTRLGPYEVIAQLGAGGMGEVYRARDTTLGREVAVKVLPAELAADSERLARLRREAQLLASISHPNLAVVHGFDQEAGRAFLVMELVAGRGLDEMLGSGPLAMEEALQLARQIAAGLETAHEAGIIHRDLKPANVRVTPGGEAKVLDFGLAKGLDTGGGEETAAIISVSPTLATPTVAGVILGTAAYMSPEQARGVALDRRTDIWSFGCVLYEMLTGERAFAGQTVTDVLASLMKDEPDWSRLPAGTSPRLRRLLRRCLVKKAGQRLRDIGDARLEIEEIMASSGDDEAGAAPAPPSRSRTVAFMTAVAATTALTVMAAGQFLGGSEAPEAIKSLHVDIAIAHDQMLVTDSSTPAISNQGDAIAYAVHTPGGRSIVLRRLDEAEGTVVRGTEGGRSPFFSPTGDWLGFVTEAGMFKISVGGGNPVPLTAESFYAARAVWHDERTILAQGRPNAGEHGLIAIDAEDGSVTPLTTPDAGRGETYHLWPSPLPDGRILFEVEYAEAPSQIALFDPAGAGHELLGIQASGPFFVLDDVLLFERAGQLFAGSFDAMRNGTSGVPQPVLPDAESGQLSIAPDGTATYIFQPEGGRRLVRVDRRGAAWPILDAPGAYRWLRFSPDGSRIALGIRRQAQSNGVYTDNYEIWGIDVASQRRWRLPDPAADATEPVWTPDGRSIIHTSRGVDGYQITRQAADGSDEPEVLLDPDFDAWTTDISPDGRHLLFYGGLANTDIWVLPLDGSGEARVAIGGRGDERGGRFSPDGRYIAYGASEGGREDVFVQPFPELDQRWTISREGGRDPVWARDGSEIFFRRGTVVLGAKVQLQPEFSAEAETELFESQLWVDPWGDQSYDVLPDGQHLAMYELVPGKQPRLRVFTGLKELLRDLR